MNLKDAKKILSGVISLLYSARKSFISVRAVI